MIEILLSVGLSLLLVGMAGIFSYWGYLFWRELEKDWRKRTLETLEYRKKVKQLEEEIGQ